MKMSLVIELDSPDEVYALMAKIQPTAPVATPYVPSEEVAAELERSAPVKTEPKSGVTQADIERELRAYSEKHGLPGARKLLDELGIKQLGKATPEQKAALAARLGV